MSLIAPFERKKGSLSRLVVNLVFTGDIVTLHIKISDHLPLKLFGEVESIGYIAGQFYFSTIKKVWRRDDLGKYLQI